MKISEIIVEQGEMSVEKDDDNETVLVDKTKGTKTVIDKKIPPVQKSPKINPVNFRLILMPKMLVKKLLFQPEPK